MKEKLIEPEIGAEEIFGKGQAGNGGGRGSEDGDRDRRDGTGPENESEAHKDKAEGGVVLHGDKRWPQLDQGREMQIPRSEYDATEQRDRTPDRRNEMALPGWIGRRIELRGSVHGAEINASGSILEERCNLAQIKPKLAIDSVTQYYVFSRVSQAPKMLRSYILRHPPVAAIGMAPSAGFHPALGEREERP